MKCKWQTYSTRDYCILGDQRKAVREAKSAVETILSLKTYKKWFSRYQLPCGLKNFTNVFSFLYVKVNSKEIVKEYPFLLYQKNADVSIFVEIQG